MRAWLASLPLAAALLAGGVPAGATESCFGHHRRCVAVCTPERVSAYYFGVDRRCTASCEPRYQHCIRTGLWADLERLGSGGMEEAEGL